MVKLETGKKLKALRVNNATELIITVSNQAKSKGILHKTTEPYILHQNGIAERLIQTTNAAVRIMLTNSGLPTEFWDEATVTNTHLRNRITTNSPLEDGRMTSPQQVYSGKKASVNYIRVQGCKYIAYVNPSSLLPKIRHDKIVLRGREAMLVGYNPYTTK